MLSTFIFFDEASHPRLFRFLSQYLRIKHRDYLVYQQVELTIPSNINVQSENIDVKPNLLI